MQRSNVRIHRRMWSASPWSDSTYLLADQLFSFYCALLHWVLQTTVPAIRCLCFSSCSREEALFTLWNQRSGWCRSHPCKPQVVVTQLPSSAARPFKELSTPCHRHSLVALCHSVLVFQEPLLQLLVSMKRSKLKILLANNFRVCLFVLLCFD